jgi:hypothetical protein
MNEFPFSDRFRRFLFHLYSQQVEYLMIGGYAVILHGYVRGTGDLDIWVNPAPENAERLVLALKKGGFEIEGLTAIDFTTAGFFRIGREPDRIDLLTDIKGVSFDNSYAKRQLVKDRGVPINVIDLEDLIANKQATGRLTDLADVEALKRQRPDQ